MKLEKFGDLKVAVGNQNVDNESVKILVSDIFLLSSISSGIFFSGTKKPYCFQMKIEHWVG